MARSKTFRKKRKYKHSNNKRTSKKTSKRTYKKRRTMKGGLRFPGENLFNGARAKAETLLGNELNTLLIGEAKTNFDTGVKTFKQGLVDRGAPSAIVEATARRVNTLANDKKTQQRVLGAVEHTGNLLIRQLIRALEIIKQELEEASAQKARAILEEQTAKEAEEVFTVLVEETESDLKAAKKAATEKAAAEKATAEKAALAEKVAAEKAAASATAEKVAAEKAATAAAAEKAAATKVSTLQNDDTITLEKELSDAKTRLAEMKQKRELKMKAREQAELHEQELRQKAKAEEEKIQLAEQEIQLAQRLPPGAQIKPNTPQERLAPRLPPLPPIGEHV